MTGPGPVLSATVTAKLWARHQDGETVKDLAEEAVVRLADRTEFYRSSTSQAANTIAVLSGAGVGYIHRVAGLCVDRFKRYSPGVEVYKTYVEKGDSRCSK